METSGVGMRAGPTRRPLSDGCLARALGRALLDDPVRNEGTAFTAEERRA
jgi:hypothetical protein